MSDDNYMVDLSGLANFTPYEGLGSNALLKQDGFYKALVTKIIPAKSSNGNPMWKVAQTIQDEDEKGQSLISNVLIGGTDIKGESMIRQLGAFLMSVGQPVEAIRTFAKNGSVNVKELAALFVGKVVHIECESESYEGKLSHKVKNYIPPQQYTDAVAANAHRKPRRADMTFAGTPAGAVTASAPVGGLTFGGANGAAGAAVDPIGKLKGLNLLG